MRRAATRRGTAPQTRACLAALVIVLLASCQRVDQPPSPPGGSAPGPDMPQVVTTRGGIEMVEIPAGRFRMGSSAGEADEQPAHEVWVDAFLMDRREITQEQFAKVAGTSEWLPRDPAHFKGPDRPVEMVRWDIAALFCNARSRAEGFEPCYDETGECDFEADGYRLPTEAEWEYACRAGTETPYSFGSDPRDLGEYAWFADNSSKKTHPVGQKEPNAWGVFDMHGNVAEWCNDRYGEDSYAASAQRNPRGPAEGEQYVLRGGAWNSSVEACRSARRVGEDPGFADACFARDAIGFRCVRRAAAAARDNEETRMEGNETPNDAQGPAKPDPSPKPRQPTGDDPVSKTGFLYGDVYLEHKTDWGHPERPERLRAIVKRLGQTGLLEQLVRIEPAPAAMEWITAVHAPRYVERVKRSCEAGTPYMDSPDTPISERSYEVALAAVGGVLSAVDAVMEGKVRNAFCAVRPPGHHSLVDEAMGFCLFNNVAIAARYVQKKHKLPKVLIVDWDVHHGNGTQAAFYDDPTVLFFSVHQFPFYPGTGSEAEQGSGEGRGLTLNAPLPAGSGDAQYKQVFEEVLNPAALKFRPDFVLVSAGFDAHEGDLLGGMRVTSEGFAELTRTVKEIADTCCGGRLISVLEGGYGLEGLAESVEAHLRVLMQ